MSKIHVVVEMVGFHGWRLGLVAWFGDYLDMERKEAIWMGAQMNVNVLNSRKTKPQALKDLRALKRLTTSDLRTKQSLFLRTKQSLEPTMVLTTKQTVLINFKD